MINKWVTARRVEAHFDLPPGRIERTLSSVFAAQRNSARGLLVSADVFADVAERMEVDGRGCVHAYCPLPGTAVTPHGVFCRHHWLCYRTIMRSRPGPWVSKRPNFADLDADDLNQLRAYYRGRTRQRGPVPPLFCPTLRALRILGCRNDLLPEAEAHLETLERNPQ